MIAGGEGPVIAAGDRDGGWGWGLGVGVTMTSESGRFKMRAGNKQGAMMKNRIRLCGVRACGLVAISIAVLVLAGCNTTKGVGADIERAGEGLKDSADRNGAD